jgi:hypothetical protein
MADPLARPPKVARAVRAPEADPFGQPSGRSKYRPQGWKSAATKRLRTSPTAAHESENNRRAALAILGPDYVSIRFPASAALGGELSARARALGVSRAQLAHDVCALWVHLTSDAYLSAIRVGESTPGYTARLVPGHGDAGLPFAPIPPDHEGRPDLSLLVVEMPT